MTLFPFEEPNDDTLCIRELGVQEWAENELETKLRHIPERDCSDILEGIRFSVARLPDCPGIFQVHDLLLNMSWSFTSMDLFDGEFNLASAYLEFMDSQESFWLPDVECLKAEMSTDYDWTALQSVQCPPEKGLGELTVPIMPHESQEGREGTASNGYDSSEDDLESEFSWYTAPNTEQENVRVTIIDEPQRPKKSSKRREPRTLLQGNAAKTKDLERRVPKTCIIDAFVNGEAAQALVDTGSMSDFVSTTLVDQLRLKYESLAKPLTVQLAVTGSRGKINASTTVAFRYGDICEKRRFDVMNIDGYDVILGTPFLYQHKGVIGFNPTRLAFESIEALPIEGKEVATIASLAASVLNNSLEEVREMLRKEAADLCRPAEETPLPPFRAINHRIPLKNESLQIPYIPSRCPQAFQEQWARKRDTYIRTGRWEYATGHSGVPMLFIPKKPGPNGEKRPRTVFAKQRLNENTIKLSSPLPDIQSILETIAPHRHKSLIDGRDAYEQIRVESKDVHKTLFNTPDGTMISKVMQQGDCNATATYQTLMNYVFAPYIGKFMYVYLDDIIIFSDDVESHVEHIRIVLNTLRREKLYLTSPDKLQFFANPLIVLGHVINGQGIMTDPHKVDRIENWKVPTNAEQVSMLTGMVQYVARDCHAIAIPLAVLSKLQRVREWKWGPTQQRAFEEVKRIVSQWQHNHRHTIDRSENADPIGVHVDASLTGAGGIIWQGKSFQTGRKIAFWSGKFNSAEQNYPTHDRELLGIIHCLPDHEPFEGLLRQKSLNERQKRWLEALSHFDFNIEYIPGEENYIADALLRVYSNEPKGIVRADSEFVTKPLPEENEHVLEKMIRCRMTRSKPLYTGTEVKAVLELHAVTRAQKAKNARLETSVQARGTDSSDEDTPVKSPLARMKPYARVIEAELSPESEEVTSDSSSETDKPQKGSDLPNDEVDKPNAEPEISVTNNPKATIDNEPTTANAKLNAPSKEPSPNGDSLSPSLNYPEYSPTLTYIVNEGEPGIQLPDCLKGRDDEDNFFAPIVKSLAGHKHFILENGLLYLKDDGRRILCVPDIKIGERSVREIFITHAHSLLAHLGLKKTLAYLRDNVWWKEIQRDVAEYCQSCSTCASSKSRTTRPFDLLKSLEVPSRPWC
ncbi:hypothetical protein PIIN_08760 [Serendipita indica DSM 11827]|uniref:Reverse transcriptase domain-containing protein n=1 Tax=Serendipita indica (strain DSM 11827) TaxID=1109443 RepID=G4TTZ8_SERID|nr:hypothetical protein PIIN_08760 [Serendipita indica DSM 11827]